LSSTDKKFSLENIHDSIAVGMYDSKIAGSLKAFFSFLGYRSDILPPYRSWHFGIFKHTVLLYFQFLASLKDFGITVANLRKGLKNVEPTNQPTRKITLQILNFPSFCLGTSHLKWGHRFQALLAQAWLRALKIKMTSNWKIR